VGGDRVLAQRYLGQFWRQVIGAYTQGRYTERVVDGEVRQRFRSMAG